MYWHVHFQTNDAEGFFIDKAIEWGEARSYYCEYTIAWVYLVVHVIINYRMIYYSLYEIKKNIVKYIRKFLIYFLKFLCESEHGICYT